MPIHRLMELLQSPLPLWPAIAGWLVLLPAAARALLDARRGFLVEAGQQHLWLAGVVALAFLWQVQLHAGQSMHFGLLGAALFSLVFARSRAILGLLAALALHTAIYDGSWFNFGANGVLFGVLPATLATTLQRLIDNRLPRNLFIFIIGNGMFVTLAATAATSLALLAAGLAAAPTHAAQNLGDYVGYALLLAWGEALLSGMIFSALVIFVPGVVLTYRQDDYLPPRAN